MKPVFLALILIFQVTPIMAQSIISTINEETPVETLSPGPKDANTETIKKMSHSGKIFIITNVNESIHKGDFITMLLTDIPVSRALVAKTTKDELAGIKILKIYNTEYFEKLGPGVEIKIVRGDDAHLFKNVTTAEKIEEALNNSSINDEEDLYNDTNLLTDDDLGTIDENPNRAIKTDNIIGLNLSYLQGYDNDGTSRHYSHWTGYWQYQFIDNVWLEGVYGQSLIGDFPSAGLDTKLTSFTLRLKYTITGPFYSFFQPYIGYQSIKAESPDAGVATPNIALTTEELQREIDLLNNTEKDLIIFGITFLKRLVPGWFFEANLGADMLSAGFCIEF